MHMVKLSWEETIKSCLLIEIIEYFKKERKKENGLSILNY